MTKRKVKSSQTNFAVRIISMIFVMLATSCNSPQIQPVEFCLPSFDFNVCSCAMFNIDVTSGSAEAMERVSEFKEFELDHCNLILGPSSEDWATKVKPYGKEWARKIEDNR